MDNEKAPQEKIREEKPLNDLLTTAMVDIYVGPESTHWYLHERLLCYYSPFFSKIFYAEDKNPEKQKARREKAYGLPDEEDLTFELMVGWLYSRRLKRPDEEKEVGPLLDLYLLSEKLEMEKLSKELVEAVSEYYFATSTYPGLRRVQYIYANTDEDNHMREMMVGAVAKQLATGKQFPSHWKSALQRNGQLAVDIIRSIQEWHLEEKAIPDARDSSSSRGRSAKGAFSAVVREGDSLETDATATTGATSNLGVESINSDHDLKSEGEAQNTPRQLQSPLFFTVRQQASGFISPLIPRSPTWSSSSTVLADSVTASPDLSNRTKNSLKLGSPAQQQTRQHVAPRPRIPGSGIANESRTEDSIQLASILRSTMRRPESIFLAVLWLVYLSCLLGVPEFLARNTRTGAAEGRGEGIRGTAKRAS